MEKPLVSIIIPVYNSCKYISTCIDSIINETHVDVEIILVDDGSTDDSGKICDEYSKRYSFVKSLHQSNSGVSCARNNGITHAIGTYIMFIDSDDFINDQLIDMLVENIEQSDIAFAGYSLYDDRSGILTNVFPSFYSKGSSIDLAKKISSFITPPYLLGPCFKLFKSNIIYEHSIEFPRNISYCEDAIFVFNYLKYTKSYVSIKNSGYYYRQHGCSTLSTVFRKDLFNCECLLNKSIESFLNVNNISNNQLLCNRLFKAFIHNLHKLSCTSISLSEKKLLIKSIVQDNQLKILFSEVTPNSLDDVIGLAIIKDISNTYLLNFMMVELKLRTFLKSLIIKIKNV